MKYVLCMILCVCVHKVYACSTASDPLVRVTECKDSLKLLSHSKEEFLYISLQIKGDLTELKSYFRWKVIFGSVRKELVHEVKERGRRVYNLLKDLSSPHATLQTQEEFIVALEELIATATLIKEELRE